MKSDNRELRTQIVHALRALGPEVEGVIPALMSTLENEDSRIPKLAFEGLCAFGPAVAPHAEALVAYAIKRPNDSTVTTALPKIGGAAILPVLLPKLGADRSSRMLLQKLQRHLTSKESARALAVYVGDPNVEVRRAVVSCLLNMVSDAQPAADALTAAVRDQDATVAWQATSALLAFMPIDDVLAAKPITEVAGPTKEQVKQIAEQMLPPSRPSRDTYQMLSAEQQKLSVGHWLRLLKDPDPHVRFAIGVSMFRSRDLSEELLTSVIEDPSTKPQVKEIAQQMLSRQRASARSR